MKIHFVDGPLDGFSKQLESAPEQTYYAPSIMYSNRMLKMEELDSNKAFMFNHTHRYELGGKNQATGTLIYMYVGLNP